MDTQQLCIASRRPYLQVFAKFCRKKKKGQISPIDSLRAMALARKNGEGILAILDEIIVYDDDDDYVASTAFHLVLSGP